mmetsp:Transcript_4713/g.16582  ORF Transcript_4713/g.16582 Transcript_4713/m.16582 type:complete len:225 (+) Transcript_4713:456-1130(+)
MLSKESVAFCLLVLHALHQSHTLVVNQDPWHVAVVVHSPQHHREEAVASERVRLRVELVWPGPLPNFVCVIHLPSFQQCLEDLDVAVDAARREQREHRVWRHTIQDCVVCLGHQEQLAGGLVPAIDAATVTARHHILLIQEEVRLLKERLGVLTMSVSHDDVRIDDVTVPLFSVSASGRRAVEERQCRVAVVHQQLSMPTERYVRCRDPPPHSRRFAGVGSVSV